MRFGVIVNRRRPGADKVIDTILNWIKQNGHSFSLCQEFRENSGTVDYVCKCESVGKDCDVVISLGGDGTLLAAARSIGSKSIPIVGINLGALGFMTQVSANETEQSLQAIVDGKHRVEHRMLLEATVNGEGVHKNSYALNDIVVDRGSIARLIELNLYVNDEFISTYRADGLIICTPTGSTAYNAAVNGPILNPNMQAIVASPMAPQSLAARPLLFHGDDVVKINVMSAHHSALMTLDGQVSKPLKKGDEVRIRRAGHTTNLITFPSNSFYAILRDKLHWAVLPKTVNE